MAKNKKLKPGNNEKLTIKGRGISANATDVDFIGSTDHLSPVFSFIDTCQNHFQLHDWGREELKHLNDKFREYSKMTWSELRGIKGFQSVNPKTFSQPLPAHISPDVTVYECRISGKARLFGHRVNNVFRVIWFDRNHEVYPMS